MKDEGSQGSFLLRGLVRKSTWASVAGDSGDSSLAHVDRMLGGLDAEIGGF